MGRGARGRVMVGERIAAGAFADVEAPKAAARAQIERMREELARGVD